ncbi:MAG: hypothetical protein ACI8W1_002473, partial [Candidatus Azotimanducaceae bacterium]
MRIGRWNGTWEWNVGNGTWVSCFRKVSRERKTGVDPIRI